MSCGIVCGNFALPDTPSTGLFDLEGRVALITGSSRGIGRAIAHRMAEHGARVVISSRKALACEAVASEINDRWQGRAIALAADIADRAETERLVTRAVGALGPIDILVCNAAISPHYGPLGDVDPAVFNRILETNVVAASHLVGIVAPDMVARGDGAVIFVSSMGALRGSPVFGPYSVSKAAVIQLARSFATEYGRAGIRVNCIAPGLIRTDFSRHVWRDPDLLERVLAGTPLGRIGEPDDVAGVAVFLASEAGRYVTGQTIVVDGGTTTTLPGA